MARSGPIRLRFSDARARRLALPHKPRTCCVTAPCRAAQPSPLIALYNQSKAKHQRHERVQPSGTHGRADRKSVRWCTDSYRQELKRLKTQQTHRESACRAPQNALRDLHFAPPTPSRARQPSVPAPDRASAVGRASPNNIDRYLSKTTSARRGDAQSLTRQQRTLSAEYPIPYRHRKTE